MICINGRASRKVANGYWLSNKGKILFATDKGESKQRKTRVTSHSKNRTRWGYRCLRAGVWFAPVNRKVKIV